MKHKTIFKASVLMATLLLSCTVASAERKEPPFLGWNSWCSYAGTITEEQAMENIKVFNERLVPFGYEYFTIDGGWFVYPGEPLSIDEWGRFTPSPVKFPQGFKPIADYAHAHGFKFGLHMLRGIPRIAVEQNMPIKGTKFRAKDIANVTDTCTWNNKMYGIDVTKPGAQAYYDHMVELIASWGVDFIKYDDIAHKPAEVEAVVKAIKKTGKDIKLSLSPGDDIQEEWVKTYNKADMVRITRDIWDLQRDIEISFERWERMQNYGNEGFYLDLDMIPFGHINLPYPISDQKMMPKRGFERMDNFNYAQKKTFITQRAMAACPIIMGGALPSSPNIVFEILTDKDMLECDQNGVCGKLVKRLHNYAHFFDVWMTPDKSEKNEGWIGIFNRGEYKDRLKINKKNLGLKEDIDYELFDIWGKCFLEDKSAQTFDIEANGVLFIHYKAK